MAELVHSAQNFMNAEDVIIATHVKSGTMLNSTI